MPSLHNFLDSCLISESSIAQIFKAGYNHVSFLLHDYVNTWLGPNELFSFGLDQIEAKKVITCLSGYKTNTNYLARAEKAYIEAKGNSL